MDNNSWNQQPYEPFGSTANGYGNGNGNGNGPVQSNNGHVPSGSLLRDYRRQQSQHGLQNPPSPSVSQGLPPPYSPVPVQQSSLQPMSPVQQSPVQSPMLPMQQPPLQPRMQPPAELSPRGWPTSQGYPSPPRPQGLLASTMQAVRSWSGKMMAMRQAPLPVPEPLVIYHPAMPELPTRTKPWKRSRTMRVALRMKHRRLRWQRSRPNGKKIAVGILIAFCLLLVVSLSSGSAYAYSYYESQLPRLQGLANQQTEQTTRIYDRNGVLLYEAYAAGGRSTPVAYKYIPQIMQDAMIAAEDHTFWTNSGVDPQGILRAATEYASSGSVQSGGSTITQQVIKNMTHDSDVSLGRKIPEAALAIGMTQQYTKSKILEMYFNIAPFGAQDIGVEAAARDFFGLQPHCDKNFNCIPAIYYLDYNNSKDPHDPLLALARASLLAGMPQNPPAYDPTLSPTNKQAALVRQDYVLNEMLGMGMQVQGLGPITPAIIKQAEALTARMAFKPYQHNIKDPHFVYWVIQQLETALGGGDPQKGVQAFISGGFNIRTTIDSNLEAYVESAVHRHLDEPEYQPFIGDYGPLNTLHNVHDSAVVVMNAKTGEVLAMDGSADFNDNSPPVAGNVNAALAPRQPGSSFKPIVYTTAFDMGWYPGMVIPDRQTFFPLNGYQDPNGNLQTSTYHPTDYGGAYNNMNSSIRIDLQNSFNVPAIKAFTYAGLNNVVNMARRFGITAIDSDVAQYNQIHHTHDTVNQVFGPSMALGTAEIPLIQMAGAYQVFANQGRRIPPVGILDIWDNYGHHIYHYDTTHPQSIQVISPQLAYLMTSVLDDEASRAYEFENDHVLSMWDWTLPNGTVPQVAAKTGTTDNFQDNWTIGYTPNVVVGVWSGNADGEFFKGHVVGITGAAPIWHDVMEHVMGRDIPNTPHFNFGFNNYTFPAPPPGVVQQATSSITGLMGTGVTDWMLQGDVPQQSGMPPAPVNGNGNNNGNGNGNGNGNNNGNGNGNGNGTP